MRYCTARNDFPTCNKWIFEAVQELRVKVKIMSEGHKNLMLLSKCQISEEDFFQNFLAFSQCLNFSRPFHEATFVCLLCLHYFSPLHKFEISFCNLKKIKVSCVLKGSWRFLCLAIVYRQFLFVFASTTAKLL